MLSACPDSTLRVEAQPGRTAVVRTRMPGGVGGAAPRGVPLSRSVARNCRLPRCSDFVSYRRYFRRAGHASVRRTLDLARCRKPGPHSPLPPLRADNDQCARDRPRGRRAPARRAMAGCSYSCQRQDLPGYHPRLCASALSINVREQAANAVGCVPRWHRGGAAMSLAQQHPSHKSIVARRPGGTLDQVAAC